MFLYPFSECLTLSRINRPHLTVTKSFFTTEREIVSKTILSDLRSPHETYKSTKSTNGPTLQLTADDY